MKARPISGATIYSIEDLKWLRKAIASKSEKVIGYFSEKVFQRLAGCSVDKELAGWFDNQRGVVTVSGAENTYTLHTTNHPAGELYMKCLLKLDEFQAPWFLLHREDFTVKLIDDLFEAQKAFFPAN